MRHALASSPVKFGAVGVRLLFVAVIVLYVSQLIVRVVVSEPYPGLFQPAFGWNSERDGVVKSTESTILVRFTDGTESVIDADALLPEAEVVKWGILRAAFFEESKLQDPRTKAWLQERLSLLEQTRHAESVQVQWDEVRYATDSATRLGASRIKTITTALGDIR